MPAPTGEALAPREQGPTILLRVERHLAGVSASRQPGREDVKDPMAELTPPSPPCPNCGHSLGWHTWGVAAIGKPPLLTLLGICQYVREQEGAKATTYRPCTCHREKVLTP